MVAVGRAVLPSEAVTVMSVAGSPSLTEFGLRERVTAVGAESLSVIVSVSVPGVSPLAVPVRMTVSSPSARVSSVGSKLSVAVPEVASAAMVTVKLLMAG